MTAIKDILNAGLAAQAAGLALSNVPRKRKKRRLLSQGVGNITGASLIQAQAGFIGGM